MSGRVGDPLIELLAIKLYEHDTVKGSGLTGLQRDCWAVVDEEEREFWRQMARGEIPLYELPDAPP